MMNLLYQIIIQPVHMLLELLYRFFFDATNYNFVYTIILISFMVSVFCLPLYLRADAISEEEAEIKKKLEPRVKSIRRNFKGDERQFILQTYYRQNNYHPAMALRSSFSLLLQIPFFIAAYHFFSKQDFGTVVDMFGIFLNFNAPDNLLNIGNFKINILPIIMTVINIEAGIIYTKSKSFKDNLNLYIISLVFLVLLYNQPAGLVFYWLFNNIFSLVKNILLKFLTPKTLLKYTFVSALLVLYIGFKNFHLSWDVIIAAIILYIIAIFYKGISIENLKINSGRLYFTVMSGFWILTGLYIPAAVVSSSPLEFLSDIVHPLQILIYPILNSFGIFLFWGMVLWFLSDKKIKNILGTGACLLFFLAIVNYFLVPVPEAHLLNNLSFDTNSVSFFFTTFVQKLVYILLLLATCFAVLFTIKNKTKVLSSILAGIITTGLLFFGYNIIKICYTVSNSSVVKNGNEAQNLKKYFHFSKTKKNVLVIFLDRAINSYFPLILKEKPELNEKFSGFTYYPNTVSLYFATILGYPSTMGGYEYSPIGMAKSEDKFEQDNDKAFSMLPLLFKKQGWDSVVSDSPWSVEKPDFVNTKRIYSDKGIKYYSIRPDLYSYFKSAYRTKSHSYKQAKRNFIFYSLMMISPSKIREYVYHRGRYLNEKLIITEIPAEFFNNYAELEILPDITEFNAKNSTFTILNNDITHSSAILNFPEYKIKSLIDMEKQDKMQIYHFDSYSLPVYHANVSALLMLGKYFDYLKENGVYDNTRIIIVSDHGTDVLNPEINDKFFNKHTIRYNPLLMVKDFNQSGTIKTSTEFMSNADTPYIAVKGIIDNPQNPYTHKKINAYNKQNGLYIMEFDKEWQAELYFNKKNPLHNKKHFSFVKDNIFKKENWRTNIPYSEVKIKENLK